MDDSRRKFCQATGICIAGAALLPAAPGCGNGTGMLIDAAITTDMLALNDVWEIRLPDHNIDLCHDGAGFYAVDANCTHAHCVLEFNNPDFPGIFHCTCHGSTFDYNGQNPTAPAQMPLQHYKVILQGKHVFIDFNTKVDPSMRANP
jgi:Rieske Fe-S protein